MSFDDIPGQERAKRFLRRLARRNAIPHALLFSGMAGVGKAAVALEFAKLLNCLSPHDFNCCNVCVSCRKTRNDIHPDLKWVRSEGAFIKIGQVRELRERLRFRPFEGKWRVVIVENAQNLREEAGNALLKLLEEPPGQNLFILTVLEPQMLLPTIVSRCCHVRFQPLDDEIVERHMIDVFGAAPAQAREATRFAQGSISRAEALADRDRFSRLKEILDALQNSDRFSMIDFFSMTAQWSQRKEDLEPDLECVKLWVRELVLFRLTGNRHFSFEMSPPSLRRLSTVSVEDLFLLFDRVEEAMQFLRQNANKQLAIEGVCLTIKDALNGKSNWNSLS